MDTEIYCFLEHKNQHFMLLQYTNAVWILMFGTVWGWVSWLMLLTAVWVYGHFYVLEDEDSSAGGDFCLQNTQIRLSVAPLCPVYSSHLSRHTNKPAVLPQNAQHSWLIFYFSCSSPRSLCKEQNQQVSRDVSCVRACRPSLYCTVSNSRWRKWARQ